MIRSLICLVAIFLLAGGGPAPVAPAQSCESVLPGIKEWVGEHQLESQGLRDEMMNRIDGLLVQFRGDVSPCISNLWLARALLGQISEQREDVLRLTAAYLAQPGVGADPIGVSRIHSVRGTTLAEMGEVVRAGQDYAAAVAFVPQLPAGLAAVALRDYAAHAMLRKNWAAAENAYDRAHRILTDSLATDPPAMRRRLGRLASDHALAFEVRLREVREPEGRRQIAQRLVAAADTAVAILAEQQEADQTRLASDQSYRAIALSQRGYGEAILGQHRAAAASQAEALSLLSPLVREINPYAGFTIALFTSLAEQIRGDLPAAARSARLSRTEAAAIGDAAGEANALIVMAGIDEQAGRLVDAERGYREAAAYRDAEWQITRSQDWSAVQFSTLMEAYYGLSRVVAAQGHPEEAFTVLDGARARALRNLRSNTSRREQIDAGTQARVDSLQHLIRDEQVALLSGHLTPGATAQSERRISLLQERVDRDLGAPSGDQAPLSLTRLRQTLRTQHRALVSYAVGDSATIAFVVTADTLVVRTLPTTYLDIQHLMQATGGPWRAGGPDAAVRLGPLHALHERLVRPLRDVLPDRDGLVIIPDGPLADLPFEMLLETPAQSYSDARFLIRRQPISTDLAAALV
ncbi:MAG TPA: CHAT domain-containing protein, partial [Rubricoccaceae bacterium]